MKKTWRTAAGLLALAGLGLSGAASAAPFMASAPNQRSIGQVPPNWAPGAGTIITGAAARRAEAIALASYPGGIVNRVLRLSDGSYAVHMIMIDWPHHVFVSRDFLVTGAIG
jgi:hypothetical protein